MFKNVFGQACTPIGFVQPQINVFSEVVGLEILGRIRNPEGAVLSPNFFLDRLIQHGALDLFTKEVFKRSISKLSLNDFPYLKSISLNIEGAQLEKTKLVNSLISAWSKTYLRNHITLKLEITERDSIVISNVRKSISNLLEEGIELSLDDYGTKHSDYSRFKSLPFSEVKFDKSLIKVLLSKSAGSQNVKHHIDMFKDEKVDLVAEGVECMSTIPMLNRHGVVIYQGYAVGMPGAL